MTNEKQNRKIRMVYIGSARDKLNFSKIYGYEIIPCFRIEDEVCFASSSLSEFVIKFKNNLDRDYDKHRPLEYGLSYDPNNRAGTIFDFESINFIAHILEGIVMDFNKGIRNQGENRR